MPKNKKPRRPYSPKSPVQPEDLSEKRDQAIVPLAREILKLIANTDNLVLGNYFTDQERVACYAPLYQKIMKLCLEKDIALNDITYAFQLVLQGLELTKNVTTESMNQNIRKAESKLWGKDRDDLTINDLENVLQSDEDGEKPSVDKEKDGVQ